MNLDEKDAAFVNPTEIPRSCANCACGFEVQNPNVVGEKQLFCRRNEPTAAEMRVDMPRVLRDGSVATGKDGKPIMESGKQVVYLYKPTHPSMVCFDGWRPVGTLPGEKGQSDGEIDALIAKYIRGIGDLQKDIVFDKLATDIPDGLYGDTSSASSVEEPYKFSDNPQGLG